MKIYKNVFVFFLFLSFFMVQSCNFIDLWNTLIGEYDYATGVSESFDIPNNNITTADFAVLNLNSYPEKWHVLAGQIHTDTDIDHYLIADQSFYTDDSPWELRVWRSDEEFAGWDEFVRSDHYYQYDTDLTFTLLVKKDSVYTSIAFDGFGYTRLNNHEFDNYYYKIEGSSGTVDDYYQIAIRKR
jgi:hypothetical protein